MKQELLTPPLPQNIVAWLDRRFPERSPDPKDSEREVWMKAGERRLVRFLMTELTRQQQTVRQGKPQHV